MKNLLFVLGFFAFVGSLQAQNHRIYFSDKGESMKMLAEPQHFLSQKSLERRAKMNIAIKTDDLPVSRQYISALRHQGLKVKFASRWFNYALVEGEVPAEVYHLPFVRKVEPTKKYKLHMTGTARANNFDYGYAENQISMLNGDSLHARGFSGSGVTIAVIDGGFRGSDTISAFDSLRLSGRLAGTFNFVRGDTNVFVTGSHGTLVLSTMAANLPQQIVGTAPHARYWLLTSEFEPTETTVEMDNWLAAAEFADSVGADVINSSLGYSTFDDTADNFSYADMDGNTTLVTKAADRAGAKGIAVIVSAGNEGSSSWQYITAPADGDSVLSIGAVDFMGDYASFSSVGPTFDGRIKPDVAAQGLGAVAVSSSGAPVNASGTSFSSPIVAGLTACLIQAQPTRTNFEIYRQIRLSASQFFSPDYKLGYGIPDFLQAYFISRPEYSVAERVSLFPNPLNNEFTISGLAPLQPVSIQIYGLGGNLVYQSETHSMANGNVPVALELEAGMYLLKVKTNGILNTLKISVHD